MVLPMRMDAVPNNQTLTALPIQVVTAVQVLTFTVLPTPMVTAFQGPESHAQQEMEIPKSVLQSALSVIALVGLLHVGHAYRYSSSFVLVTAYCTADTSLASCFASTSLASCAPGTTL